MKFLARERGKLIFYLLFIVIPLGLWISDSSVLLFDDYYNTLTTLGKAAGIVGLCFFAANIFLSGRYTFIDKLFGGLDRVYFFHRRVGITAFTLLSVHLLAITLRNVQYGWQSVIDFTFDLSSWPVLFGRLSYYGLIIIIFITLYVRLRYERLKLLHTFLGVFLFLGGLHAFLIPSDIAANQLLRFYVLGIATLSLISYAWRTVLKRWLVPRIKADVIAVNKLGDAVTEVVLKPRNQKINFIPGQFNFWRFKQENIPYEDHPFSITSSTEEDTIRLSAKALGDFTKRLPELRPGAVAEIQGPYGGFSFLKRSQNKKQIWIAGGIGITPFMSMARSLRDRVEKEPELKAYDISLFYSVKNEVELIYGEELKAIANTVPNFTFFPWVAEHDGFITAEAISKKTSLSDVDVFICGPKPLLNALNTQFVGLGISKSHIHFELFRLL
jgi:predicted ferric reductase